MTNVISNNGKTIKYWNPQSGGMVIVEDNATNTVDFLVGRRYIKNLIDFGWSTNNTNNTNNNTISTTNTLGKKTNALQFVPLATQQWISVVSNDGNYCLVSIQNNTPIKIILKDAPITLYKDPVDFSRKIAIRENERNRLEKWGDSIEFRDGQLPTGVFGDPAVVDRIMKMRFQLNAEASNYKIQVRTFEANCRLLDKEIADAKSKPAYHHPKQVKAYFTGKKVDDVPVWNVVR